LGLPRGSSVIYGYSAVLTSSADNLTAPPRPRVRR
jgi:hypothetical protein